MSNWETYYKVHTARKAREQTIRAAELCVEKDQALDLGAGTLVESASLLESGFKHVTAVDSSEQSRTFAQGFDPERFTLDVCSFTDFISNPTTMI